MWCEFFLSPHSDLKSFDFILFLSSSSRSSCPESKVTEVIWRSKLNLISLFFLLFLCSTMMIISIFGNEEKNQIPITKKIKYLRNTWCISWFYYSSVIFFSIQFFPCFIYKDLIHKCYGWCIFHHVHHHMMMMIIVINDSCFC